ncbi:hypothetical protein [Enterobacter bugandensis]|uniref:hypothetical protein n=1 Tax=Enterobacter bugandensis TaxID=881260 RepID=UPI0035AB9CC9
MQETGWNIHHRLKKTQSGGDELKNLLLLPLNCHRQLHVKLSLNKRALKGLSGMLGNPHVPSLGGGIAAMLCLYPTPQFGGVLAWTSGNPSRTEKLLSLQPVEEIWGSDAASAKC